MNSPPTVAVDLRALVPLPTGIGVYTRSLMESLARGGTAQYVGWSHKPVRGAEGLEELGLELETQWAPLGFLWQQLRVPRRLERQDVDVFWSPLMTLPWSLPVPGVVTVHDLTVLSHPRMHTAKVRLTILPVLRRTLEKAAAVVAISQATAADVQRFYPEVKERLEIVYNGVDDIFQPGPPDEIAALRREIGCPDGYLFYAGTLEPRKNVGAILDAWEALRKKDPATPPLVLAGAPGWHNEELMERISSLEGQGLQNLGRVPRQRLVQLYQGASVFIYPSHYEGFGLPPLEAMACGVPVVVSNVSSLPEVVGDAGLQVSPDSPAALAEAVAGILNNSSLRRRLQAEGLQRSKRFSWDRAAREMEHIFRRVAAGPPPLVPLDGVRRHHRP